MTVKKLIKALQKDFYGIVDTLDKTDLEEAIKYLRDVNFNEGLALIKDTEFDYLVEIMERKYGKSEVLEDVGAKVTKDKVALPYYMGSMDKIKPEKNNLDRWLSKYKGPVCISDKLDGISALFLSSPAGKALYTRGDGTIGQNITHILPYIKIGGLPIESFVIRGELIVSKENYERVKEGKAGARQMVAGLLNQKTIHPQLGLIDFVAYEVIVPERLKPSEQLSLLKKSVNTVPFRVTTDISIAKLGDILTERKKASLYELDGIIVAHDAVYPRVVGKNPDNAFAFKMAFEEQKAVTEVVKVDWRASKDGYLKPTVNFEPVNIAGVTIQYATGFNAKFIQDYKIGPGAFIEIIRSGDVIPHILSVKIPSPGGSQMPEMAWHWNETHVDAIVDDLAANPNVQIQSLLYFTKALDVAGLGEATVVKLYEAGIRSIKDLLGLNQEFLVKNVPGFRDASAKKLIGNIKKAVDEATIVQLAVGSGIFGRGIGMRRLEPAFGELDAKLTITAPIVGKIATLSGWSHDSAVTFVRNIDTFKDFLESIGKPIAKNEFVPVISAAKSVAKVPQKLAGQRILFTGFHPKDLELAVKNMGGTVNSSITSTFTLLVIKDSSISNEKTKKALKLGIPIMTADEFRAVL